MYTQENLGLKETPQEWTKRQMAQIKDNELTVERLKEDYQKVLESKKRELANK